MQKLKIKPLTKEQLIISIDRLTRFKNTETKYLRVFYDVITHNLISPAFKKTDLETLDYSVLRDFATEIINFSINQLVATNEINLNINRRLLEYEKSVFRLNEETQKLLQNKINYSGFLKLTDENSVKNLLWLNFLTQDDIINCRRLYSLKYPPELLVLVEGATEEILLPVFAKLCNFDFDKEGVHIISAGGKNQVVKLYYELTENLKLPVFILLDKDGRQNAFEIETKLRACDRIHILNCGEFEDLYSTELIKRTLNYELKNISEIEMQNFDLSGSHVEFLESVFKNRGMHEFKKVEFAQSIEKNILSREDLSTEIESIISEISSIKNTKLTVDN